MPVDRKISNFRVPNAERQPHLGCQILAAIDADRRADRDAYLIILCFTDTLVAAILMAMHAASTAGAGIVPIKVSILQSQWQTNEKETCSFRVVFRGSSPAPLGGQTTMQPKASSHISTAMERVRNTYSADTRP